MKSTKYAIVVLILGLLGAVSGNRADAQTSDPCVIGYTVGFFNGVWNTELEAIDSRNATQDAVREATGNQDDTYNNEDVNYVLFYNHTGSTVGATGLQDIAETFEQRAQELDPSGNLSGGNFYLFWEPFNGQPPGYADTASAVNPTLQSFLTKFQNYIIQQTLTELSALFSNPPTQADYAAQWDQLDTLAAAGRKFLLVAHSQGNLFVNPAYDHIQPVVGSTRVKVVHIAPASPTLRGNYELSLFDTIINALRLVNGFNTVPKVNIDIPFSTTDKSGHTLTGTYLDESRPGRANSESLLLNALGALVQSSCAVKITPGSASIAPGISTTTTLTASLNPPNTDSNVTLSYAWSVTGNAGGLLSSGQGAPSTTAASLSPTISYISSPAAPVGAIDTVKLTVYVGTNLGDPTKDQSLGTAAAVLTISPGSVTLTPSSSVVSQTGHQIFIAAVPRLTPVGYSFKWVTTGTAGLLNEVGGAGQMNQTSYCSTSAQANYIPNPTPTLTTNATDTVTVQAFNAANCPAGGSPGAPAQASVTVTAATLLLTPRNTSIVQTDQLTLLAQVSGTSATNFSYKWTTSGTAGLLDEVGGTDQKNQISYCSTSTQSNYVPNATPLLTASATDTITVQAFSTSTCAAADVVSAPVSTTVTVTVQGKFIEKVLSDLPGLSYADLIQARDGNLYGTTAGGGTSNLGTVFKLTPGGTLTILHSFTGSEGSAALTGLIEGRDGDLYGTNVGAIYKITPQGAFTILYSFTAADGGNPAGVLVQGSDGNFYGTTAATHLSGSGEFFMITPSGTFTVLTKFTKSVADSAGAMIEGADGNFYGTSMNAGLDGRPDYGSIFKVTPTGTATLLWLFTNNAAGASPNSARLVQESDGSFYGTAPYADNGTSNQVGGVVYRSSLSGNVAPIYTFFAANLHTAGYAVNTGLELGSDGNLYGATVAGGGATCDGSGCGTVYRVRPTGDFSLLYAFGETPDAHTPWYGTPLQAADGNLYGLTSAGGSKNTGAAYVIAVSPGLPAPIQLSFSGTDPAPVNQPVTLTWKVLNAFSITSQQCVASVQGSPTGAGTWSGIQSGTVSDNAYSGSATITPTVAGTYTYALTCGGRKSGFATLSVQ